MSDKKGKTFFGKLLRGVGTLAGVIAPGLKPLIDKATNLGDLLNIIQDSGESDEVKMKLREYALEEQRLNLEAFEVEVADRASAREREYKILEAGGDNKMMYTIGWGNLIIFMAMISAMIIAPELVSGNRMFDIAFGAVSMNFGTIVAYFYGSTMKKK